mmetsp:Transcript_27461/g.33983  ORF Transcript_27461/g.33983 Transcript_27461/m.33983 type:complete len:122 (-) Transcript_27461:1772-2137(-)
MILICQIKRQTIGIIIALLRTQEIQEITHSATSHSYCLLKRKRPKYTKIQFSDSEDSKCATKRMCRSASAERRNRSSLNNSSLILSVRKDFSERSEYIDRPDGDGPQKLSGLHGSLSPRST